MRCFGLVSAVVLGCAVLAACSGPGAPPPPSSSAPPPGSTAAAPATPAAVEACATAAGAKAHAVAVNATTTVTTAVLGDGPSAVVLANESAARLCQWFPFATTLAAAGYRVVLWDYERGTTLAQDQAAAVVASVRADHADHVLLMGASQGAKVMLVTASMVTPPVAGVVSLSAEAVLDSGTQVAGEVTGLRSPALLVTATEDRYGSATAGPDILRAIPGPDKRLLTVPGTDHGVQLLSGPSAATVTPAVLDFLARTAKS